MKIIMHQKYNKRFLLIFTVSSGKVEDIRKFNLQKILQSCLDLLTDYIHLGLDYSYQAYCDRRSFFNR